MKNSKIKMKHKKMMERIFIKTKINNLRFVNQNVIHYKKIKKSQNNTQVTKL